MPCSASSTATLGRTTMVRHEALLRVTSPSRCVSRSLRSGRDLLGSGGPCPVSLAQAETLLRDPLRRPQAPTSDRMLHDRSSLLHATGHVEAELVPAGFW